MLLHGRGDRRPDGRRRDGGTRRAGATQRTDIADLLASTRLDGAAGAGSAPAAARHPAPLVPDHVRFAGQVLQFKAFFTEALVEAPGETYRRRILVIRYHLEDDSVEAYEVKRRNDGIFGSKFHRRMRDPDVTPEVLRVGENLTLYNRTFRIIQCDDFTRKYYEEKGMPQTPNEEIPSDPFEETLRETVRREHGSHAKKSSALKRFLEAASGAAPKDSVSLRNHLDFGHCVFRFFLQWQDPPEGVYENNPRFVLSFYLASTEVDIRWIREDGSEVGAEKLLRRQRLPLKWIGHDDRAHSCEPEDGDQDYYHAEDFIVGSTVNILGRSMLIYDCDRFTHEWYLENMGVDQKSRRIEFQVTKQETRVSAPPPPTGFGSEQDSLQSWKHLVPKPPRPVARNPALEGRLLKFSARLISNSAIDRDRRFRLNWYMEDDSMAVFEPSGRNSGIEGGKWQRRAHVRHPTENRNLRSGDLYVGAEIHLKSHPFIITSADRLTLDFMEAHVDQWPMADFSRALRNVRDVLSAAGPSLADELSRRLSGRGESTIDVDGAQAIFDSMRLSVHPQELTTIMRRFDPTGHGVAQRDTLVDVLIRLSIEEVQRMALDAEESHLSASARAPRTAPDARTEEVLHLLGRRMLQGRVASRLHESLQVADRRLLHTVSRADFRSIVQDIFGLRGDDLDLLEKHFAVAGESEVHYDRVLEELREFQHNATAHATMEG